MKRVLLAIGFIILVSPVAHAASSTLFSNSTSVGIGTTSPAVSLDMSSETDALALPAGTSAQRPGSPVAGDIRYNTSTTAVEAYYNSIWNALVNTGSARIRLTANQTFYLSTTGSDSNSCLTSGAACATLTHVWDLIATNYDLAGYTATIQLADGTYTTGLSAELPITTGPVVINGDSTTPSNVVISTTNTDCVDAFGAGVTFFIQNLELTATGTDAGGLAAFESAVINMGPGLIFGAVDSSGGGQIVAQGKASIFISYSYSIVGGGAFHYYAADGSLIRVSSSSITATLTGTPAFGEAFAASGDASQIIVGGLSYSGSATGTRYDATLNGIVDTDTGNTTFLPGNTAGVLLLGGQYD